MTVDIIKITNRPIAKCAYINGCGHFANAINESIAQNVFVKPLKELRDSLFVVTF